jgi:phenylalanyl-tRNA synthetase beta chain
MKVLYSELKKLVPKLKAKPKEIGDILTMIGYMLDGLEEVKYQGKKDFLLSLEVRQNRADCLGAFGIARELAAYYGIPFVPPQIGNKQVQRASLQLKKLKIDIKARKHIKRVLAAELTGLKNSASPAWLKDFLEFYGMNSINLLVDVSNYVMILTGYPSHLFDNDSISGNLIWNLNSKYKTITTLDGSIIELNQKDELIIENQEKILALAGVVGGARAALKPNTTSIIAELAIYDRALIGKNSRDLHVVTEASNRLEKDLDPNGAEFAFKLLIDLILKYGNGTLTSQIFNYYPKKRIPKKINFDPGKPGKYAGIEISKRQTNTILKNLRFKIKKTAKNWTVTPPADRMDVELHEDVIEEVIRMVNYKNIPKNEIPKLEITQNITPALISMAEQVRDILIHSGYDEVLSPPLIERELNQKINYLPWDIATTQNSVNEEYPDLRQSIAAGLLNQLKTYQKKNIEQVNIFEIGKIFGKEKNKYKEHESLGILTKNISMNLDRTQAIIEKITRNLKLPGVYYIESATKPNISNPYSCWDLEVNKKKIGIIYKLKPQEKIKENLYFAELDLEKLVSLIPQKKSTAIFELTKKIVTLDANVELTKNQSILQYLKRIREKIKNSLWSLKIHDVYPLKNKVRYTVRASYKEMSDKNAKELHLKVFDLE